MRRPFLASWPLPGRWRVGANGFYYPIVPMPKLDLRVYRCGHLELRR